ncbi:WhiB family transcriptional regulator [Nocardia cyriacigeorgica]|uniref:WhiB family transcriptional regulator n=1 Tax=Nocardia cyriacigeorgica TaxID=135487 RepID=UPI0018956572|nr:WhiB family transcriptional regulator [Nocardia cyriacigeorgica]MBF6515300.1 WhiB family transcriptional regulator [Nocardia cyriacigeorgica]
MTTGSVPRRPRPGWREDAACRAHRSPEWWQPERPSDPAIDAKTVCVSCPVRIDCGLTAALSNERVGVWAGFRTDSTKERRQLRKWLGLPPTNTRNETKP